MTAPRIAIVCRQVSGVTGTTTTILEHCRRFKKLGWQVHVYGEDIEADRIKTYGAIAHSIVRPPKWLLGSFVKRRLFNWLFERSLRAEKFDLVCGHGDTLAQDILSLHNCVHAAHEAVHGRPLPENSSVGRFHARILGERKFTTLVANSHMMKDEVSRRFGVPGEKITVIYPGHDPERFRACDRAELGLPARRELGLGPDGILVGLITSGDFIKRGVGIFLEALGRLSPQAKSKIHILIIGRESRLAFYRAKAGETGLGEKIRFLAPSPRVERYYHALDVYVHPALYEEFGQSVQEAMACGVPVLTSARVGAAELFKGKARELLLEQPEAAALAERLERLIEDASLRRHYAQEGILAVQANTWEDNFKATLACYRRNLPALYKQRGAGQAPL